MNPHRSVYHCFAYTVLIHLGVFASSRENPLLPNTQLTHTGPVTSNADRTSDRVPPPAGWLAPSPIPKGLRLEAQRCEPASYAG
jgi:hypothetical protein